MGNVERVHVEGFGDTEAEARDDAVRRAEAVFGGPVLAAGFDGNPPSWYFGQVGKTRFEKLTDKKLYVSQYFRSADGTAVPTSSHTVPAVLPEVTVQTADLRKVYELVKNMITLTHSERDARASVRDALRQAGDSPGDPTSYRLPPPPPVSYRWRVNGTGRYWDTFWVQADNINLARAKAEDILVRPEAIKQIVSIAREG